MQHPLVAPYRNEVETASGSFSRSFSRSANRSHDNAKMAAAAVMPFMPTRESSAYASFQTSLLAPARTGGPISPYFPSFESAASYQSAVSGALGSMPGSGAAITAMGVDSPGSAGGNPTAMFLSMSLGDKTKPVKIPYPFSYAELMATARKRLRIAASAGHISHFTVGGQFSVEDDEDVENTRWVHGMLLSVHLQTLTPNAPTTPAAAAAAAAIARP